MTQKSSNELIDLILAGKSDKLEFSDENLAEPSIAKHIVAFLNSNGGTLIFGIDDDSQIVGIQFTDLEYRLAEITSNLIFPAIFPSYYETLLTGKKVGVLEVEAGTNKPYYYHWKDKQNYYVRNGKVSREASTNEIRTLINENRGGRFELTAVSHATINDLDLKRIHHFCMTRRQVDFNALTEEEQIGVLEKLDLAIIEGDKCFPTVAGILLFGKNPESSLAYSGVTVHIYNGQDSEDDSLAIHSNVPMLGIIDSTSGEISLAGTIDETMDIIRENFPRLKQKKVTESSLPLAGIREALLNALMHRNYCIPDKKIEVNIFEDKIEIVSPGEIHQQTTLEKIKFGSKAPGNLLVYNYLAEAGYFDKNELGIYRIILDKSKQVAGKTPELEEVDKQIKVTFFLKSGS
ncbi:putative DNA binding domain-containing protein [candidate division KSB1 bacterium]|nr:putative DNA binding domain-containing protein [candidate division KSB1 bacterium]